MSLYQALILDHYRNPRHKGNVATPTHHATNRNPTCGDALSFTLSVENDVVTDIRFTGTGCVISQAAASILTETVIGKSISTIEALTENDFLAILGIPLSLTRKKCALLAWQTLRASLKPSAAPLT